MGGYVGRFDLRDAGTYTLQVIVGAYFGATDPQGLPVPIPVGTHTGGCSGEFPLAAVILKLIRGTLRELWLPLGRLHEAAIWVRGPMCLVTTQSIRSHCRRGCLDLVDDSPRLRDCFMTNQSVTRDEQ